jgi:hypothetical protein
VIDAVAAALAVQPDRAARLLEALDIIGEDLDDVRLVRVFQGEKGPQHAVSRGEFHYVIDRVAAPRRRDDRRGRGDRGERRGGGGGGGDRGGFGGRGDRDKPRGLGSLKAGAAKQERDPRDDRPGRGEMPRAGIGWQLQSAPRSFDNRGPGRGPKRGRGPGGPGGPRDDRRGPPRDDRRGRGRGPRPGGPPPDQHLEPHPEAAPPAEPRPPRLGPDGNPLPPRSKRPRKPIGPDANGLGPDGTPWDPERRAKRQAERDAQRATSDAAVNTAAPAPVEPQTTSPEQAPDSK